MKTKRVLSLFSGCGGMDLGFEGAFEVIKESINLNIDNDFIDSETRKGWVRLKKLNFKTVFANDIKESARILWVKYFSKYHCNSDTYFNDSIVDLVKKHKANTKIFPDNIDVVTGGFPCQDFSVAGKRKGFNSNKSHNGQGDDYDSVSENRGKLYVWMKEVVEITKPKIFIAENVKGLVNLSNVKEIIQKDFSKAAGDGYIVINPRVLFAPDYGVPQTRERVIFIGLRKNALRKSVIKKLIMSTIPTEYDPYPIVTHTHEKTLNESLLPYVNAKKALKNLKEPDNELKDLSQKIYSKAKFMGTHCQGQKEINLSKPAFTIRSEHHGNIEFRRLSLENGGKYTEELSKGLIERRLTVRECARFQTFPDDFEFILKNENDKGYLVNSSDAYRAVGNAVPPLLAFHIAYRLQSIWDLLFMED